MTQSRQATAREQKPVILERNGLTVECFFSESGKLERKIERCGRQSMEYACQYDAQGRLTEVRRNGVLAESYQYNQSGQRVEQRRECQGFSGSANGMLLYDGGGRLLRAGDVTFAYDKRGALAERRDREGVTRFCYNGDTMPDKVALPDGTEIRYEYDKSNPIGPARRFAGGVLTAELAWSDPLRLAAYRDYGTLLEYSFAYTDAGIVDKARIAAFRPETGQSDANRAGSNWLGALVAQKKRQRLHDFLGGRSAPLELLCGCDQVGTLKLLTDKNGRLVKEITRDSFGVQEADSFPDLFLPIGFAGGLVDPDTGLVRFGWRDYDPAVGRFTAPDPLGDTGGDHDLYEYCLDDPVTMNDPSGLIPPLVLFLAGKALALGLGLGVSYGAAAGVDAIGNKFTGQDIKGRRPGTSNTPAWDGVNRVAPMAAGASAVSAVPGVAATAPGAAAAAAQRIGAAMAANPAWQRFGPEVIGATAAATSGSPTNALERVAYWGAKAAEGVIPGGTPDPSSWPAMGSWILKYFYDESKK